jgi:hypothetical protein
MSLQGVPSQNSGCSASGNSNPDVSLSRNPVSLEKTPDKYQFSGKGSIKPPPETSGFWKRLKGIFVPNSDKNWLQNLGSCIASLVGVAGIGAGILFLTHGKKGISDFWEKMPWNTPKAKPPKNPPIITPDPHNLESDITKASSEQSDDLEDNISAKHSPEELKGDTGLKNSFTELSPEKLMEGFDTAPSKDAFLSEKDGKGRTRLHALLKHEKALQNTFNKCNDAEKQAILSLRNDGLTPLMNCLEDNSIPLSSLNTVLTHLPKENIKKYWDIAGEGNYTSLTPLHSAATTLEKWKAVEAYFETNNAQDLLKSLLLKNPPGDKSFTPVSRAALCSPQTLQAILLRYSASPEDLKSLLSTGSPLHSAKKAESFKVILNHAALIKDDPDFLLHLLQKEQKGSTPLHDVLGEVKVPEKIWGDSSADRKRNKALKEQTSRQEESPKIAALLDESTLTPQQLMQALSVKNASRQTPWELTSEEVRDIFRNSKKQL